MDRTRIPEASLVGLLAALATFCALEARGGQPYSIVGQSSPATAATGRRPLAERIKAANRPIRIAAEEELAPDQGLIPALDDPNTVEREWIPGPAVVEFPTGGPEAIAVDEVGGESVASGEPGVMPPPDSTAIAARPTTGDDAGLVGEASTTEPDAAATTADADAPSEESAEPTPPTAEGSASPPDRLPAGSASARSQAGRVPPPRRTAARVTPQRREALLERLRTALAEVPRPLGLIPAPSRQPANARRPQGAPRGTVARHPVPASSLPQPLTALKSTTPTDASLAADSLGDTTPAEAPEAEACDADVTETLADSAAEAGATTEPAGAAEPPLVLEADAAPSTGESTETLVESASPGPGPDAGDTPPDLTAGAPEAIADVASTDDAEGLPEASTGAVTATIPAADPTSSVAPPTATPAPRQPVTTNHPQARRNGGSQRPRVSNNCQPPMTPLDRLQARLEQMPRALGLVPAPRPSMHATRSSARRTVAASPAVIPAPVATATSPGAAAATDAAPADDETIASDEAPEAPTTIEADVVLDSPQLESLEAEGAIGDDGSTEPTVTPAGEPTLAIDAGADGDRLALVEDGGESTTSSPTASDTESGTEALDAVASPSSAEAPALVTTSTEVSVMPAPATEPVAGKPDTSVAKRPTPRHHSRQPAAPAARRPIRDALGTALANMPRPFGLLPETESVPHRRPAANPANGTGVPRALATKSIGTRPLEGAGEARPDVARATVAAPPATTTADDGTTLTSGNDADAADESSTLADSGGEPATLDAERPEGFPASEAMPSTTGSVEVTIDNPEASTSLGERITLHLTIHNPGTGPVSSVTPVVHFGAGLEPLGIRGRNGHFSADGSVTFDRLPELPAGESVELEIIAVCTGTGTIPYRGVAVCGDGDVLEMVPADATVTVTPTAVAAEPTGVRHR